ncbi:GDP-mannose 4,6-dehydratase [Candidatus Peribacteria bacterium]|jgi:GDPmannose 4,6-dehydratase|nr:GDP-mannose 4,6-dehydratase [Candidatus Peribacteria bacterium]MBT4021450.1 GDP-mannose 4,6-dehydratase [Candidatus Peribacteria bacterium]MBT4240466.1 GDP-mannose 4,6-dehydratase [Candidatus Peribacteria bacterium]MBT4474548.1 GDP-mannose 4,6-dehydratase [Candidatus Peribacteria bacterium]
MPKAFITGTTGQDGAYLSELLLSKGYEVHGLVRDKEKSDFWRLVELDVKDKVNLVEGDLTDEERLKNILTDIKPDEIYNLAAQTFVGASWHDPVATADINAMGTLKLLEAFKNCASNAKFYQASTSEMYGGIHTSFALDEATSLHPRSPYATSKLFAHWMTVNYRESFDLFSCSGILFNHESPLRGIEFVTRKITDGVARIKLGLSKSISLGNIDAKRDWGFAGDYVEAMWLMLQQEKPEDFVISTGVTHSIHDLLDIAFEEIGINDWSNYITQDPKFMRPSEVKELCGKNEKAKRLLGWEPKVEFKELVKMMVEKDLERLEK